MRVGKRRPRRSNRITYFCIVSIAAIVVFLISSLSSLHTLKVLSNSDSNFHDDDEIIRTYSKHTTDTKEASLVPPPPAAAAAAAAVSLRESSKKGAGKSETSQYYLMDDIITKSKRRGILQQRHGDALWPLLIDEAVAYSKEQGGDGSNMNIMEVGMHSADQSLHAAVRNLRVYGIEPSPKSRKRIIRDFTNTLNRQASKNVRFYQMAAGAKTGIDLDFTSTGGTGDHVGGGIDIWTMTKLDPPSSSTTSTNNQKKENKVTVKSVAIDDIILTNTIRPTDTFTEGDQNDVVEKEKEEDQNKKFFLVKIDTQGFEPSVFAGLHKSIEQHRIDFIITEYWPKGIDFMNDSMSDPCIKPVEMLELLAKNGYKLFANPNVSHPGKENPIGAKRYINDHRITGIPFHDLKAHCMWYYEIEKKFPSDSYKMGYWTDILAVSPQAKLRKNPITELGQILQPHLHNEQS